MKNNVLKRRKRNTKLSLWTAKILSLLPFYPKLSFFPKKASKLNYVFDINKFKNLNLGIVIQGPPLYIGNFTYETLKFYKKSKVFKKIVFSTTSPLNKDFEEKVKKLDITILKNTPPKNVGYFNIGHQICNSLKDVEFLKENKCTFCVKTRSDQRIYSLNSLLSCYNFLNLFPIFENPFLKYRIVFSSLTRKYIPYHLGDFFQFGHIDDVSFFFNCAEKEYLKDNKLNTKIPEMIFAISLLKNLNFNIENNLSSYYVALKRFFIVCDHVFLDIHWLKYHNIFINSLNPSLNPYFNYSWNWKENLSFQDWINIYSSKEERLTTESLENKDIIFPDTFKNEFFN